jgi:TonB family protein
VAAAGGTAAAAGTTFMSITKLQIGIASALAVAGATGFVVQAQANAKLQAEVTALRQETTAIDALKAENRKLARAAVDVSEMRRDDAEFARLQQEAATLKTRLQQLAQADAERQKTVYAMTALDLRPVAKFQARPRYPDDMRAAGISGEVVVDFVVDNNGDVQKAFALRSSQREFEAAAVEAVSKWKFKPGQKGGSEVATRMQVPIVFTIPGTEAKAATSETKPAGGGSPEAVKLQRFEVQLDPNAVNAPKK